MPRACTICTHPDRATIEASILSGESNRRIASQCDVSEISVRRHQMAGHVTEVLVKAHEVEVVAQADTLLDQIKVLHATTLRILKQAEDAGKFVPAAMLIREARGNLELLAKMVGELDERAQINIMTSPQMIQVQAILLEEFADVPDRRVRLAARLAEIGA